MSRWAADEFHADLRAVSRLLPRAVVGRATLPVFRRLGARAERRRTDDACIERVSPTTTVRLHRPPDPHDGGGALLWIHGGGLIMGTAQQDDRLCRHIARDVGITVAAVDYRLAPEHPYPAPLDDCRDALLWLGRQPNVDPDRIAIGGASAGGGLAAALALRVHAEGSLRPIFQLLVYPMLDDRTAIKPDPMARSRRLWNNKANALGWGSYLGERMGTDEVPPFAAPARCTNLSGAPSTWIGAATLDLFHDENVDYAARLTAAGVPCELMVVPGGFHGFDMVAMKAPISRAFHEAQITALKKVFSESS